MSSDTRPQDTVHDVVIVGGGVSGAALLYVLSRYADIPRIALLEKHKEAGSVNSLSRNNSQTLHIGDIESNYSLEKARQVRGAASMVARYGDMLPKKEREEILFPVQKILLAVGDSEVRSVERRFHDLKEIYPTLRCVESEEIARVEPKVVEGRPAGEKILALVNQGLAVNYGKLARSFLAHAREEGGGRVSVRLHTAVSDVERSGDLLRLVLSSGEAIFARVVVFDADAYSLFFAKRLGYGREFSLIPVAGTFYFSRQLLQGKVYTVQDPRLPFAAVHGDPDVEVQSATRWGPTARFFPVLEARNVSTMTDYFRVSGLHRARTWASFVSILLDPVRAWFLFRNVFYEIPLVGNYLFARQVRKIVPTVRARDFTRARGFGGMRLQRVDTRTRELLLGEGKIVEENIIFNMSPSPGASVCLYNAMRDAEQIIRFLPEYSFDKKRMLQDLCLPATPLTDADVSLRDSYAS